METEPSDDPLRSTDAAPVPPVGPKVDVRLPEFRVARPKPRLPRVNPDPPRRRPHHITWRRWTIYLILRLLLVAFAVIVMEVSSTTAVHGYLYLALLPTLGALLIPYRTPGHHQNPDNIAGIGTLCVALLAVAIWPYDFYATATAPRTPAAIITTETFRLDPSTDTSAGCIGLIDDQQRHWLIGKSLLSSVKNNKIVLYQTQFGWTPDSQPTQSPTPFFDTPHLNQVGYVLTPSTVDATVCQISHPSRYGG